MAITTLNDYINAAKVILGYTKTSTQTTVAAQWSTLFDRAGNPGAGTLSAGNTANGLVPDNTLAGMMGLPSFGGGLGYVSNIDFGNTIACRMALVDRLFHCGAYAFNANVTLTAQPSYSGRIVASNYAGLQIWIQVVTTMTGALACTVTYTNQAGTTGRSTGAFSISSGAIAGRMFQMPLQGGDTGVQKIESVLGATASAGTFNIVVVRPLWSGRVRSANDGDVHGLDKTGLPQIFATSALEFNIVADSTLSGVPDAQVEIAVL